jgi:hypothetical protein
MRSFDYARTTPEARKGFPVFVVVFAVVFMAADHRGGVARRQSILAGLWAPSWLNPAAWVGDKPP